MIGDRLTIRMTPVIVYPYVCMYAMVPHDMGGVCSCGSETPTLNKGKLLVKSIPLFRDTNHYLVLFPYTLH